MEILTTEKAKKIANNISHQINPIDNREFFLVHSEKVGKVAKNIAEKVGLRSEVFEIAGRVHDIGYAKDIKNHADYALSMLEELGYEMDDILKDCIINHGGNKTPTTKEGKIFQLADKLSVFDADIIEIILRHGTFPISNNDIIFLKDMSEKAIKLLENYKQ